jgi:hypothetical protein
MECRKGWAMMRITKSLQVLLVLGLALPAAVSCAGPAARVAPEPAAPQVKPAVIDDLEIVRAMETEGTTLFDSGKTVPMKDLVSQLNRTSCDVTLTRPSGVPLDTAQVYERCKASVLVMGGLYKCPVCGKNHCSLASGFILTESGVAVTNYHVVNSPKNLTLVAATADGKVYPVREVLAACAVSDVAIVQLEGSGFTPLPIVADAPVGSEVRVISHPDGRFYTLSTGIISRYGTIVRDRKKTTMLQITAEYARGSSGGPVLDSAGAVVGMVSSTMSVYYNNDHGRQQDFQMVLNECVPAAQVLELINPQ